jgi:nucleotide-binding universal stress UspA family protein
MFTRILVAVSARSADTVLASAIEIAQKYDAQVVALHVVDPTPCYLGAADCNSGLIVDAMEAHGRKFVTQIWNQLDGRVRVAEVRMVTLPMSGMTMGGAIAAVADETGADMILLGARGSFLRHWLTEDVASEVMRCSGKPTQIAADSAAVRSTGRGAKRSFLKGAIFAE